MATFCLSKFTPEHCSLSSMLDARQRSHTKTDLRAGCLYVVSLGNGLYKIGRTTNLKRRLVALSSANANLDLVGVWAVPDPGTAETVAHEIFARFHQEREWFRIPNDELVHVVERLSRIGKPELVPAL